MSSIEQLEEQGKQVRIIAQAVKALLKAEEVLSLVNKHGKEGTVWRPKLRLKDHTGGYYNNEICIELEIPFGVVQQQAIYQVDKAKRNAVMAGWNGEKIPDRLMRDY